MAAPEFAPEAERGWPLRRLLLGAYVGLLGAALLALSTGIYALVGHYIEREQDSSLRWTVEEAWHRLSLPPTDFRRATAPFGVLLPPQLHAAGIEALLADLARPDRPVRWRDGPALVKVEARERRTGPPVPPSLEWWSLPFRKIDGRVVNLEVGLDRKSDRDLMAALARYLAFCSLLILTLAAALCSRLSSYWLAPLNALVVTMARLADGDLAARPEAPTGVLVPWEWRRLSQSLAETASRLQASFSAQRRFVADASHELRTPLTSMAAMAEMLEAGTLSEGASRDKAVRTLGRETQRMARLVESLLTLSKAEEGSPLAGHHADVEEELAMLNEEFAELHPERPLIVEGGRGIEVLAPGVAVHTVLRNLLENAYRYSDAQVTCRARVVGSEVELQVEDHGSGIPEEEQALVFERFYRSDPARARASGGAGLGLAIVKALVEKTGGRLTLSSEPGRGTIIRVYWKRSRAA